MRGEKREREKWCFWEEGEGEGTDADALGGDFICAAFPPASGEQTSFAAVVGGTQETGKQAGGQAALLLLSSPLLSLDKVLPSSSRLDIPLHSGIVIFLVLQISSIYHKKNRRTNTVEGIN